MKLNLDQIENRLQSLIENNFSFARRGDPLAHRLVEAMQTNLTTGANGSVTAPNQYTLQMNPQALSLWQANPELLDRLADMLERAAREAGVRFISPPTVRLSGDPAIPPDEMRVTASMYQTGGGTAAIPVINGREGSEAPDAYPSGAFLIINGVETFPLRQPVVNIGRKLDNHVIIGDARVSRSHAQLRAIRGRYVLFDLNSSGGTFVNGMRVYQHALKPGDVISLAGVPIIYGEEVPPSDSDTTALIPGQPSSGTH